MREKKSQQMSTFIFQIESCIVLVTDPYQLGSQIKHLDPDPSNPKFFVMDPNLHHISYEIPNSPRRGT